MVSGEPIEPAGNSDVGLGTRGGAEPWEEQMGEQQAPKRAAPLDVIRRRRARALCRPVTLGLGRWQVEAAWLRGMTVARKIDSSVVERGRRLLRTVAEAEEQYRAVIATTPELASETHLQDPLRALSQLRRNVSESLGLLAGAQQAGAAKATSGGPAIRSPAAGAGR